MNLMTAWIVALGMQSYHSISTNHTAPLPSQFLASGIIFAGLSVIGGTSPNATRVVGVVAWGLVIAIYLAGKDQTKAPKLSAALYGQTLQPSNAGSGPKVAH